MNNTDIYILTGGVILFFSGGAYSYRILKRIIKKRTDEDKPLLMDI